MSERDAWSEVQDALADLPGDDGAERRRAAYAPFFLRFGADVRIDAGCRFYFPERIALDDDVRINLGALVYGSGGVWIGRHARIGPRCFIHSANHDTGARETAFFERGYIERPVRIGDNVLISANVSILPGAEIGSGVFVAAGALVPGERFPDDARLMGVPARGALPETPAVAAAPEAALVAPERGHWRDAARHLLVSLGLPQFCVVSDTEDWPASVQSVLVVGPADFAPDGRGRAAWRLGPGGGGSRGTELPLATVCARAENGSADAASASLFWCLARLSKGGGPLSTVELAEWLVALWLLRLGPDRPDGLPARILAMLRARAPAGFDPFGRGFDGHSGETTAASLCRDLAAACRGEPGLPAPALLALEAVGRAGAGSDELPGRLDAGLARARTTRELLLVWTAARAAGDAAAMAACEARCSDPTLWDTGLCFPRTKAHSASLLYSPLVAAWHFLRSGLAALPDGAGSPLRDSRRVASVDTDAVCDPARRTVARSLLDDWLALHRAPCPERRQVLLEPENYAAPACRIADAWIAVFRAIQSAAGRPLVRLDPWPAPYRAALALRYDVDRPVEPVMIRRIGRIQRQFLGGAAGSWYFFADRPASALERTLLARHWQEIGLHAKAAAEAGPGIGVTHHSAPNSDYWEGDRTLRALDRAGSAYGEFLATQLDLPRPAWVAGAGGNEEERLGGVWLTPLHFPLEGSTADTTLDYFDRLGDQFRAVLQRGGLAVVASHPDLNQNLLIKLLRREELAGVWPATVGGAVERCRLVRGEGMVQVAGGAGPAEVVLVARRHIADLSLTIYPAAGGEPLRLATQLLSNRPRRISWDA